MKQESYGRAIDCFQRSEVHSDTPLVEIHCLDIALAAPS
jgi:hypothetical protein